MGWFPTSPSVRPTTHRIEIMQNKMVLSKADTDC